jgi:hypothetical protein
MLPRLAEGETLGTIPRTTGPNKVSQGARNLMEVPAEDEVQADVDTLAGERRVCVCRAEDGRCSASRQGPFHLGMRRPRTGCLSVAG